MECIVCLEHALVYFRACCRQVICQACLDDIKQSGGQCLCQQQIKLLNWESHPVCLQELGAKLLEQVQQADTWFWSTQYREFVDMSLWEDYLQACMKSLFDYVHFLDRVAYYQVHGKYPSIDPWTFESPGRMYYAQVYTHDTYNKLVEEGMQQVQLIDPSSWDTWNCLINVKVQTLEICIEACKKHPASLQVVHDPTYDLYMEAFKCKNISLQYASIYNHLNVVQCLLANGTDDSIANYLALQAAIENVRPNIIKCLIDHVYAKDQDHEKFHVWAMICEFFNIQTAIDIASMTGHLDIVQILQEGDTSSNHGPVDRLLKHIIPKW